MHLAPLAGDVRDAAFQRRVVDQTAAARGWLDILVNNAGGPPPGTFEETPDDARADAFDLSLRAGVRMTRLAAYISGVVLPVDGGFLRGLW